MTLGVLFEPTILRESLDKDLLRLEEHHRSFRETMFWSSTGILLNDKAKDRSKVAISLLGCCGTPLVLQISPATGNKWSRILKRHCNQDIDVLQNSRKVRRSLFGSCHRLIVVIPLLAEPVDLLLWTHVFKELFLMLMFLEHLDQLWRYFVAVHPAVSPLRSTYQVLCSQQCCFAFPVALRILLRFPRW